MTSMLLASLLLAAPLQTSDPTSFVPELILSPPGGPQVVLFTSGFPNAVSLRLSIPLTEAHEEAGAAQVIRASAEARMAPLAARIGARVEVHRTTPALVYQVTGATVDLDFLVWILRTGLQAPSASEVASAMRRVRVEVDQQLETAGGTLSLRLREALSPDMAPLGGTPASLERLNSSHIQAVWARSHLRSEARLVVAGDVPPEVALASLTDLGLPEDGPTPQVALPPSGGQSRGSPEVIRHWVATAYPIDPGSRAQALVVTRLLAELIRSTPGDYELGVELWELSSGKALVVSGAAYPRSQQAMRSRVTGLLGEVEGRIEDARVREAARELSTEVRSMGRTPAGLAELVGQAWDAGDGPEGVQTLVDELGTISAEGVRAFLRSIEARTPVREEVRP